MADGSRLPELRRPGWLGKSSMAFERLHNPGCLTACLILVGFTATALGATIFIAVAALTLSALWELKRRPGSILGKSLLAAAMVMAVWVLLLTAGPPSISMFAFGLALSVGLVLAVFFVRRRGPRWQYVPFAPSVSLLLTAAGVGLGIALGLFFCLDETAEHLPRLEVPRPHVADTDNGFVVLGDLTARVPVPAPGEIDALSAAPAYGLAPGTPEWRAKAEEMTSKYATFVAGAEDILAKPFFVSPRAGTLEEVTAVKAWQLHCLSLGRLLAARTRLLAAGGDVQEAVRASGDAIRFGRLIIRTPDDTMAYLIGASVLETGMEAVRDVPVSPFATEALLRGLEPETNVSEDSAAGLACACRGDLQELRVLLQAMARLELASGDEEQQARYAAIRRLARRPMLAFVKVNAALNPVASRMDRVLAGLDHYRPLPAAPPYEGLPGIARRVGWVRLVRNFVGCVFADTWSGPDGHVVRMHFRLVAESRLTQIFLALRCYQLENGRLPARLDELAPKYLKAASADPFSEKPFIYEPARRRRFSSRSAPINNATRPTPRRRTTLSSNSSSLPRQTTSTTETRRAQRTATNDKATARQKGTQMLFPLRTVLLFSVCSVSPW